jgi:signal transduction histidine kinase
MASDVSRPAHPRWTLVFGVLLAIANAAIFVAVRTYAYADLDAKVRTLGATETVSSTDGPVGLHVHELPVRELGLVDFTEKFVQILVLQWRDTGRGIPAPECERIFERFFRIDQSRARHTGGKGLGLAICREVLRLFGGTISVHSSSQAGTVMEIRLPGTLEANPATQRCAS